MSEIRVLEAITPSRIGGAEVYVAELCAALPSLGGTACHSELARNLPPTGIPHSVRNDDVHVELWCPAGRPFVEYAAARGIQATTWSTHGKFDPLTVVRLARLIKSRGIDVVHTHLSTASLLGAIAARFAGRPSVAHVHGLNSATCFRQSTRIIAVSDAVKQHLVAQGIREEKIRVVHNGVDSDKFEPTDLADAKLKLGYAPDAPLFGVFGRLSPEKGQRIALEAMFLVMRDHPNARLVLAGQGVDWDDLQASAKALGIGGNVQFAGFVHNVRHLMSACDAVIVPSLKEGFGLAAVEAMALERPVVASTVGGLNEIVVQGETGTLVAPNDPNAIARALMDLISDKPLARRLGKNGRERVRECFEFTKQTRLALSILREMV